MSRVRVRNTSNYVLSCTESPTFKKKKKKIQKETSKRQEVTERSIKVMEIRGQ